VLLNLLGNALKFTPEGGGVTLQVEEINRQEGPPDLHFAVSDSGVGIAASKWAAIFEPFVQADGTITRRFGGTGLGLSISKRLVELMGGRIWVESREGVGSTFHFTIALKPYTSLREQEQASAPAASGPQIRQSSSEHSAVLLLVEDNQVNQRVAIKLLEKMGFAVEVAVDGAQAVARVTAEPGRYALIFMDCQMPVMDGFSATQAIRAYEAQSGRHVPIIAMTASAMESDEKKCFAAGMDDFMAKPIDVAALRRVITRFVVHPPLQ
jgi:CheY-like chemotaxis protein